MRRRADLDPSRGRPAHQRVVVARLLWRAAVSASRFSDAILSATKSTAVVRDDSGGVPAAIAWSHPTSDSSRGRLHAIEMLAQDAMNADPIVVALEVHVQQLVVDANDHADPIAGHDRVGAATPTRLVLRVHKLAGPADSQFSEDCFEAAR